MSLEKTKLFKRKLKLSVYAGLDLEAGSQLCTPVHYREFQPITPFFISM